ncbi:hypothetical protein BDK88_3706 [Natrinema hispanicum]|uniref:Uncharacterized protein n=1 Tax=Natrinema hispanicum TaxID=392421 RepID=A0A482Y2K4_9EURY|nr:hypothetical protein BDK88_3706 [Natrinema hispanicum]
MMTETRDQSFYMYVLLQLRQRIRAQTADQYTAASGNTKLEVKRV